MVFVWVKDLAVLFGVFRGERWWWWLWWLWWLAVGDRCVCVCCFGLPFSFLVCVFGWRKVSQSRCHSMSNELITFLVEHYTLNYEQLIQHVYIESILCYFVLQLSPSHTTQTRTGQTFVCLHRTPEAYGSCDCTNLWHLELPNAAMMLQYSQAVGLPWCLTLYSHFLQIVSVLLRLRHPPMREGTGIQKRN